MFTGEMITVYTLHDVMCVRNPMENSKIGRNVYTFRHNPIFVFKLVENIENYLATMLSFSNGFFPLSLI